MDPGTISLVIGLLTFIGGIATLIQSRRLVKSQSRTMDADAFEKFQSTLTKLQERNDEIYQENVTLQVADTNNARTIQQLTIRLEERDAQLSTATKQLDLLRELARTAPVTETLKTQLGAMNTIVANLQSAQAEMNQLMIDREKAYKELFDSTRNLKSKPVEVK